MAPGSHLTPGSQLALHGSQLTPSSQLNSNAGNGSALLSALHGQSENSQRPTSAAAPTLNGSTAGQDLQPTASTQVGAPMSDPILKGPTPGGLGGGPPSGLGPTAGNDAPTASDLQLQFGQFGIGPSGLPSGQNARVQRGPGGLDEADQWAQLR